MILELVFSSVSSPFNHFFMQTSLFIKDCEAFKFKVPPSMLVFSHELFLHHMQVAQKVKQLLIIAITYGV